MEVIKIPRDLTGLRFGRWTVVSRADDKIMKSGYHEIMWNCKCDCGTERVVRGKSLTGGISQSCGCMRDELQHKMVTKHGGFGTRLYAIWNSMRQRCNNPHHKAFDNYGGRGITICQEWNDYSVFRDWAISSGYDENAPRGEYTLDRIDVDGGYCPENCRWSNMTDQARNRRRTILVQYNGEEIPLSEMAEKSGTNYCTAWARLRRQ